MPGTTHGGQHKSRNYLLWSPACLPLRCMCEICCSGMCRALAEGKVAQSHCLPGKRWQIHDRLSRSRCTRGNKHCGTGLRVTLHGFTGCSTSKGISSKIHEPLAASNSEAVGSVFMVFFSCFHTNIGTKTVYN